jgi:tetratricopeptide (TPR) repeat protein
LIFLKSILSFISRNTVVITLFCVSVLPSCKTSHTAVTNISQETTSDKISDKDVVAFKNAFFDGNKQRLLGNYDIAEKFFLKALEIDPKSSASMYELASIYAYQKNKKQALSYSKQAAAIDPKNIWYQLLYASCLKENKQLSDVAIVYERLIKDNPENIDFYYELANTYLFMNKVSEATKVYVKIEERIGVTEQASMQKLKIYRATNNFDKAVEEVKKLITAFPKEPKYYGILGELYQEKGMNEKAMEAYNDLLKMDPTNAYVHLSLADYYRNLKQNDKAFSEIKIAFESKELEIDTKIKILLSYYDITEKFIALKADADTLCEIIVRVHPDDAKAFSVYGGFLYRDKKFEEARTQYRKAVALDKEKYALWEQLLTVDSELNDFVSMAKESKEAMELFPNQFMVYYYNGSANMQLKNYQQAISALTEGKEFVYDNKMLAYFYTNIGDAQNQLKNYTASDSAYDKVLQVDPTNSYVLNNYSYYLSLRNKNLEKAEAMSKKSNELEPNTNYYQDTYGWILYQMKKYDDAKVWIGKALKNGGEASGTILEHYGDILFQLGDKDEALKYWQDAKKYGGGSDLINKKIEDKKLYE